MLPGAMGIVLIVDDNLNLCRAVMAMVRLLGGRAESATGGEAALAFVRADPAAVGIIILDRTMPGPDGLSVFDALQSGEGTRDVPVVFYTMAADEHSRRRAEAMGAAGVLDKGRIEFKALRPWVRMASGVR